MIDEEIEEVQELTEIAYKLRDDSFPTLYIAVRQSLEAHNVTLHDAKDLICLALSQNHFSSQEMEMYTAKLERVNDMKDLLAFLLNHHFIGYINYALLRRISKLANDSNINSQFEHYEQKCKALFKKASVEDIMEMFHQYPDLKPLTAIGLPRIVLRLKKHWCLKPFHTWNTTFAVKVSSSDFCLLHEIKKNCVLITYAVLPSALPAVLKDLRDPAVLKELEDIGVTVVQLPDEGNDNKLYQYTLMKNVIVIVLIFFTIGNISNESMINICITMHIQIENEAIHVIRYITSILVLMVLFSH